MIVIEVWNRFIDNNRGTLRWPRVNLTGLWGTSGKKKKVGGVSGLKKKRNTSSVKLSPRNKCEICTSASYRTPEEGTWRGCGTVFLRRPLEDEWTCWETSTDGRWLHTHLASRSPAGLVRACSWLNTKQKNCHKHVFCFTPGCGSKQPTCYCGGICSVGWFQSAGVDLQSLTSCTGVFLQRTSLWNIFHRGKHKCHLSSVRGRGDSYLPLRNNNSLLKR